MTDKLRKIVIIGAGHVGSHCGYSLLAQGEVDEIVFIDVDSTKGKRTPHTILEAFLSKTLFNKKMVGDFRDKKNWTRNEILKWFQA